MSISGGGLRGQWLGDYQLQRLLAVGGMAEVYQARDALIDREVAVKVLPLTLAADPNYVERFRNEVHAVGALNHPNIVLILVFRQQGPYLYLVMPLMKVSLRDRLLRSAPSDEQGDCGCQHPEREEARRHQEEEIARHEDERDPHDEKDAADGDAKGAKDPRQGTRLEHQDPQREHDRQ